VLKVTVAIPCYNGSRYIGAVIESVLGQSRPADEVLVVDDGSTDGSVEIISRYPVGLICHKSNQGVAAARNSAIEAATGDVILFIDADAVADANLLAVLLSGYNAPEIGGVGGQGVEVNVRSLADRWRRKHAIQSHGEKPRDVEFLFGLCMSFRVDALREIGGFNPAFRTNAEDMDVSFRLKRAGYRLRYLPDAKVYHQRTDDEASLVRAITAWYEAAYRARWVNNAHPSRLFAGTLRRLVADPLADLIVEHDWEMARLSWRIGWIKLGVIWRVSRTLKRAKFGE